MPIGNRATCIRRLHRTGLDLGARQYQPPFPSATSSWWAPASACVQIPCQQHRSPTDKKGPNGITMNTLTRRERHSGCIRTCCSLLLLDKVDGSKSIIPCKCSIRGTRCRCSISPRPARCFSRRNGTWAEPLVSRG